MFISTRISTILIVLVRWNITLIPMTHYISIYKAKEIRLLNGKAAFACRDGWEFVPSSCLLTLWPYIYVPTCRWMVLEFLKRALICFLAPYCGHLSCKWYILGYKYVKHHSNKEVQLFVFLWRFRFFFCYRFTSDSYRSRSRDSTVYIMRIFWIISVK